MLNKLFSLLPQKIVFAHCDIPCGIYDPHSAQVAAHSVIRMTQLIMDLKKEDSEDGKKKFVHALSRYTKVKEDHAEIVKHEIRVLWADYFKEEHLKDYPDLHSLVFKTLKLASKARQEINMDASQQLLTSVQEIAEIFYKTKGVTPVKLKSVYPTGGEIVSYK